MSYKEVFHDVMEDFEKHRRGAFKALEGLNPKNDSYWSNSTASLHKPRIYIVKGFNVRLKDCEETCWTQIPLSEWEHFVVVDEYDHVRDDVAHEFSLQYPLMYYLRDIHIWWQKKYLIPNEIVEEIVSD